MSTPNEFISDFYLKQKEYGYLKGMDLNRVFDGEDYEGYNLTITLCDYPYYEGNKMLMLNFLGVRDFKIGNLEGLFQLELRINDISDSQMEGIKYRVIENENLLFSFYCKEFEFKILEC